MSRLAVSLAVAAAAAYAGLLAYAAQDGAKPPAATPTPTASPAATPAVTPTKTPEVAPNIERAPKEPVPITSLVETWYAVQQDGEYRGFAHETIAPAPGNKYSYFFECDFDYLLKDPTAVETPHVSMQVNATLEEDFDPVFFKMTRALGDESYEININSTEEKRLVDIRVGESQPIFFEFEPADSHMYFHNITLYKLRHGGGLNRDRRKVSRPSGIGTEIELVEAIIGKAEFKESLGRKYVVSNLVRFQERAGVTPEFYVDRYGRILERRGFYSLPNVKMIAVVNPDEARGSGAGPSARGRRDPFKKQLTSLGGTSGRGAGTPIGPTDTDGTQTGPELPPVTPDTVQVAMDNAGALIARLREHVAKREESEAGKVYQEFLGYYAQLRPMVISDPNKLGPLDKLKFDAEETYEGCERLLRTADTTLATIDDLLSALDVDGIKKRIEEMKKLKNRREFINEDVRLGKLIERIRSAEKKRDQASARQELARKRIDLTGVVLSTEVIRETIRLDLTFGGARLLIAEPVQLKKSMSYAVINDEYYREGDTVKGEDVRVDKIFRQAVQISYKEEIREVPIKKEGTSSKK